MEMKNWAEEEVRIACEREKEKCEEKGEEDNLWEYGEACYKSALKAYDSLCEDGHSGMSISLTKYILDRLIEHKPLTPIEDTDDIWGEPFSYGDIDGDLVSKQQCKRYSALFKGKYKDGTVKYNDVERVVGYSLRDHENQIHWGLISDLVDEMFPIKMPYFPMGQYKVAIYDFLYGKKGDFDTVKIISILTPTGDRIEVNKYYKENARGSMIEIDAKEYNKRFVEVEKRDRN